MGVTSLSKWQVSDWLREHFAFPWMKIFCSMALALPSTFLTSLLIPLQQTLCLHPDLKSWYSSLWCTVHKTVTWWALMIRVFLQFWLGWGKSEFLRFCKLSSTISTAASYNIWNLGVVLFSSQFTVHQYHSWVMCAWQVGPVSHFVIQRQGQGPKVVRHHHHRHRLNQHHH